MLLQIVFKCFNINVWGRDWAGVTATITRPLSIFLLCFCVAWKQLMINWEFPQYWYHHAHHHREGQILSTRAGNVHLNSGVIFIITWLIKSSSKYSKFWSFWKALKTPLCIPHCQLFKCQVMTMICGPQVNQVIKMQFKKNGEQQDKWCKIKYVVLHDVFCWTSKNITNNKYRVVCDYCDIIPTSSNYPTLHVLTRASPSGVYSRGI